MLDGVAVASSDVHSTEMADALDRRRKKKRKSNMITDRYGFNRLGGCGVRIIRLIRSIRSDP